MNSNLFRVFWIDVVGIDKPKWREPKPKEPAHADNNQDLETNAAEAEAARLKEETEAANFKTEIMKRLAALVGPYKAALAQEGSDAERLKALFTKVKVSLGKKHFVLAAKELDVLEHLVQELPVKDTDKNDDDDKESTKKDKDDDTESSKKDADKDDDDDKESRKKDKDDDDDKESNKKDKDDDDDSSKKDEDKDDDDSSGKDGSREHHRRHHEHGHDHLEHGREGHEKPHEHGHEHHERHEHEHHEHEHHEHGHESPKPPDHGHESPKPHHPPPPKPHHVPKPPHHGHGGHHGGHGRR